MSDYQEEYNTLTGKTGRRREALESSTGLFKDYVHMTWDVEKDEKGGTIAKIYRPLNNPVEVE